MALLDHIPGWSERSPVYSTLPTTPTAVTDTSSAQDDTNDRVHSYTAGARPRLSRFLADFTLGFADGLTVPFALTAGLSSLGQTKTVIYAGMAEICAGCISMGIGGYLAAKGEQRSDMATAEHNFENEGSDEDEEMKSISFTTLHQSKDVNEYIAPLQLPPDLLREVMSHIESSPGIAERVRGGPYLVTNEPMPEPLKTPPVISGLSVAIGYLLGGLLPLAPYFFVGDVTRGLIWSFGICIGALFIFGFTKEYVLHTGFRRREQDPQTATGRRLRRSAIKRCLWEGIQMAVFGGIAAVAAVLCVKLFEGIVP